MSKSSSYHHTDLKHELLATSRALIAESGLHEFSVVKLAKRAGVSSAAPYRHFADRDELLAAIASDLGSRIAQAFEAAAHIASPDPVSRLAATAGAYTQFVVEHGVGLELVFDERFQDRRFEAVHEQSRRIMDILLPLALDASDSPEWSDSIRLLEAHIALAYGYAAQHQNGALSTLGLSTAELAKHATDAARDLIRGFRLRRETLTA